MGEKKEMFLNPKQKKFLRAKHPVKLFLGGRGSGKTHAMGVNQRFKVSAMPRSKGFIAAVTYNQILTKTLPAMINSWSLFGLVEGLDYVIGIVPPRNFAKPLSPPKKFSNVISFSNGRCVEMLSLDRQDLVRGGSYDDGDIDEAALLKQENWTKILLPSIRGNRHIFSTSYHGQVCFYTSIPWKPAGYWILDFEKKMEAYPDEYLVVEASAYDNLAILGAAGIERMKREMPHGEFLVEVMNQRIIRVDNCFYEALSLDKHSYSPSYTYKENEVGAVVTDRATDYRPDYPLDTSWDFGGWFNCCTVWQGNGLTERMINSFHAAQPLQLDKVVNDFCDHYAHHTNRIIKLWGEPRGHDRLPSVAPMYEQLAAMFRRRGWETIVMVEPGYATRMHVERREFVNMIFSETDSRLPKVRINDEQCKAPLIAMQGTETTIDGRKDKSKEKERDYPQEHATHYTDNIDYYLMQKHGWRITEDAASAAPGEVMVL